MFKICQLLIIAMSITVESFAQNGGTGASNTTIKARTGSQRQHTSDIRRLSAPDCSDRFG
jgi:hypothetical protein